MSPHERLLTAPFLLCFAANFGQECAWSLFLHFPGFVEGLGASAVEVGWVVSVGSVSSIALRPAIGRGVAGAAVGDSPRCRPRRAGRARLTGCSTPR